MDDFSELSYANPGDPFIQRAIIAATSSFCGGIRCGQPTLRRFPAWSERGACVHEVIPFTMKTAAKRSGARVRLIALAIFYDCQYGDGAGWGGRVNAISGEAPECPMLRAKPMR